jgi:hypothetical protein
MVTQQIGKRGLQHDIWHVEIRDQEHQRSLTRQVLKYIGNAAAIHSGRMIILQGFGHCNGAMRFE